MEAKDLDYFCDSEVKSNINNMNDKELEEINSIKCGFKAGNKGELWIFDKYLFYNGAPITMWDIDLIHKLTVTKKRNKV